MDIKVVEAGVDPNGSKPKCSFCGKEFKEGEEKIDTCTMNAYVTLCRDCYDKAGNSVR